ncbi:MAG TPA: TIGR00296 family protein, partial [Thermoplasmata archaeon]
MVSPAEGAAAVRLARAAIERAIALAPERSPTDFGGTGSLPRLFDEARGVFVTLRQQRGGALRGCIGFPLPVYPLRSAIPHVAVAAALEDPRFPPMSARELGSTRVEVSILTVPAPIRATGPTELMAAVEVGRDGLIAESEGASGLLLPQVATEQGWNASTFLSETCVKAGLPADAWRHAGVQFRKFQAEVFGEQSPNGAVVAG